MGEPVRPFVHLHTHTEYSLLDGASRIADLMDTVAALGQNAVAITDHGTLSGALEFYLAATARGINPVIGCEMYVAPRGRTDRDSQKDRDPFHLILLAENNQGYRNLIALVTRAHLEGYYYKPRVDRELLRQYHEGLICLSGCLGGELSQTIVSSGVDEGEKVARDYAEIFGEGNYFLEIQNHGIPEETAAREGIAEIARRTGLPLVATGDAHYVHPEDWEAHDILLCLQTNARQSEQKRFRFHGPDFFLASTAEMEEKFPGLSEAIANTQAIADRCHVTFDLERHYLPTYEPMPEGQTADQYLAELCREGVKERYGDSPGPEVYERLDMELHVIEKTGFAAYFLIVWDLIRAARDRGVGVGPGRGSAAGSLVAYALHITNICPLKYGLIFERFLNLERVQMPDIDIDFDDKHRERAIEYALEKYGAERVCQIITFGTMGAKAAIRDVGRVLDVPLSDIDRLAKLIPVTVGMTLDRALSEIAEFREQYESQEWARTVVDNARKLEGLCRNASTHAAAVVIGAEPLINVVPLQRSTGGDREGMVTQFDMNGVSKIGLLKIDFLGLANLSIIEDAVIFIREHEGIELSIDDIPLDDPPTYQLLCKADTYGVFQSEGAGGKRVLIDMQPATLEDIAVAGALNRPGPIEGGVIEMYIKRKRGEEAVEYAVPELERVLGETYGTIIYQDQVMQIASAVAGFSLGEADVLRAAMGKKDKSKMAHQKEKFTQGAAERGISEQVSGDLFDLMAFFAGYGFNKAHAVAYGLITYQTAFLKANHPVAYLTALCNSRAGDHDKLREAVADCALHGISVKLPSINESGVHFTVLDMEKRDIAYGLADVKNVGEKVVEEIVKEREANGPYANLFELCSRVAGKDLNKRVLEALIKAGACDGFGDRVQLLDQLESVMDRAVQIKHERAIGQLSLFGDAFEEAPAPPPVAAPVAGATTGPDERLQWEREFLGMYLSEHPLSKMEAELDERSDTKIGELGAHLDGLTVQIAGIIKEIRTFVPKRSTTGQKMAFLQLEDLTGNCEVVVFAKTFEDCASLMRQDQVVVVRGKVEAQNDLSLGDESGESSEPAKLRAEAVFPLDDARLLGWKSKRSLTIRMHASQLPSIGAIRELLVEHEGDTAVILSIEAPDRVDDVRLGDRFAVRPGPALQRAVESVLGPNSYRLSVDRGKREEAKNSRAYAAARG